MRMIRNANDFTSDGALATRQTTIGGDAKIVFAILSGMVTDSIEYCIREPSTNAWEANRKKPFELTLPTRWNATIRFRDFGPGLSDNFMMKRYAKIGESTKDGKDDEVGGWGFGSKSPLAYLMSQEGAGAFSVTSRHKGLRSAYVIGLNEQGKIQITCLAQEPMDETDRGTGLEVSFPVRESDIDRFTQYVDRILWGFNPQPVILPLSPTRLPLGRGTVVQTGPGWTLYETPREPNAFIKPMPEKDVPWRGPHIRMGCVLYPVQLRMLDGLTGFLQQEDCLLIEAPIGSVDVSTSREQLSYTDRTKAALSELFIAYETSLVSAIQTMVDASPNYILASRVARDECGKMGWERAKSLFNRLTWRGKSVQETMFENTGPNAPIRSTFFRRDIPEKFKASTFSLAGVGPDVRIVVEHSAYRSAERLATIHDGDTPTLWLRVKRANKHLLQDLLSLAPDSYTVLDDIKLPPRDRTEKVDGLDKPLTKIRNRRQVGWDGEKFTSGVDLLGGGCYVQGDFHKKGRGYHGLSDIDVHISGNQFDRQGFKNLNMKDFKKLMQLFSSLNLVDEDIPIVITKENEVLEGDWVGLGEFMSEKLNEHLDTTQLTARRSWDENSFNSELVKLTWFPSDTLPSQLDTLVVKTKALLKRQKVNQTFNEHDRMLDAMNMFMPDVSIPQTSDPSSEINDEWYSLIEDHPILDFMLGEMITKNYDYSIGVYTHKFTQKHIDLLNKYFELAF